MPSPAPPDDNVGVTDDELVRLTNAALDPPWNRPTTPTRAQALEIVREIRRRRRRIVDARIRALRHAAVFVLLPAVVIGTSVLAAVLGVRTTTVPPPIAAPVVPAPVALLQLPEASSWQPARVPLGALATSVRDLSRQPATGRYTHTRTRVWSLDMTATNPKATAVVRDEQRWWASDGSGRATVATIHGWVPGMDPGAPPRPDPGKDLNYGKNELGIVAPDLAEDVFVVSSQLAGQEDPANGPQATLRAVREVYRFHDPNPAQRAALLQALADTDGLMIAGTVDGGAGRRGLAIVVDSDQGATRDIAIVNPDDGRLLAYDTVLMRNPPAVTITVPALSDSLLFISSSHTDNIS